MADPPVGWSAELELEFLLLNGLGDPMVVQCDVELNLHELEVVCEPCQKRAWPEVE